MLATSRTGERSRRWVHERIWGSRDRANAQASLRRELSSLRTLVNTPEAAPLIVRSDAVALDLSSVVVDIRDPRRIVASREEFLEGIDIAWEEGFEDWLREERQAIQSLREDAADTNSSAGERRPHRTAANGGCPRLGLVVREGDLSPEQSVRCDRIARNLAERCVALRWLHLVETLSQQGPGGAAETVRIGRLLNLDYVVTCELRAGGHLDIGLHDAESGRSLWSNCAGAVGNGDADSSDARLEKIVAALAFQIETDQTNRTFDNITEDDLDFRGLLWRARWHKARLSHDDLAAAAALLRRAERLEPNANELLLEQAECELARIWVTRTLPNSFEALLDRLALARDKDPSDARAWLLLGVIDIWRGRPNGALPLLQRALALNPSLPSAYAQLGVWNVLFGSPEEAIGLTAKAIDLAPSDKRIFHRHATLALAHMMVGDYAQAIERADCCMAIRPDYSPAYVYGLTANWLNGSSDEARRIGADLLSVDRDYDANHLLKMPFRTPEWPKKLYEAFQSATGRIEVG